MSTSSELGLTRKQYQSDLRRRRKRTRRRRRIRARRVKLWRTVRTLQFWSRVGVTLCISIAVLFWAKFAYVYNIPAFLQQGDLAHLQAYVTVKPWWFGPPMFNLNNYLDTHLHLSTTSQEQLFLSRLGSYQRIVTDPQFVWVLH
jgi:hypothetical protein